jgi:predicted Zn finger-like uncharacterized protein
MILTCPRCATRFLVEDAEVRAEGRRVRCSACDEEWRAFPHIDDAAHDTGAETRWPEPPTLVPAETMSAPAAEPIALAVTPEPVTPVASADLDEPAMVAPITTGRDRRGSSSGRTALILVAILLVLVVLAVVLRGPIVQAIPAVGPIYSQLGIPPAAASHAPHG